jgi:predicted alpha/beta-hydrolase family hydrolase
MTTFIFDGPVDAPLTFLLAHGAGGAMDSLSMNANAKVLADVGMRVARFEFAYMAARRERARKSRRRARRRLNPNTSPRFTR